MPRYPRLAALLLLSSLALAHEGHSPAGEMADAAEAWLASLDSQLRQAASFPFDDGERENWHFVPKERNGVTWKDMNDEQRRLARALVSTGLSDRGQLTADAIMALEDVLFAMSGSSVRDRQRYYFTVFGTPSSRGSWGWRLEGHHLSINFTVVDGEAIAVTPQFFGSNPAEVRIDHPQKGRRALAEEEDQGRALLLSFSEDQRRTALIATRAPAEVITGNDRVARLASPTGLAYSDMTPDQQARLRRLVGVYASRLRPEIAEAELLRIAEHGWNNVHFAWAGSLTPGQGHYYRIHSPRFVIEYDNTQNGANHIHTSWRNFEGDFGRDLLREHYRESHQSGASDAAQ